MKYLKLNLFITWDKGKACILHSDVIMNGNKNLSGTLNVSDCIKKLYQS